MVKIITSIIFFFIMISNITYAEIFKLIISTKLTSLSQYKIFQPLINKDKEKLKWVDGSWRSFKENFF